MATKTKIFILGATGYIGGTVLNRLLQHHTAPRLEITALVRDAAKIPLLSRVGVKTVFGTLNDATLLERQAAQSDIVFACANYEHAPSYAAILKGLKKRHQLTGAVPIFFQNAGSDEDKAGGMYASDDIRDDMDPSRVRDIGLLDLSNRLILDADKQGYIRSLIILPASIYGVASGQLVRMGISKPRSAEIDDLIRACILRKHAGMVGRGLNIWSNVHIDDVGDLYMLVYEAALGGHAVHGPEGKYFGENGECTMGEICEHIGEALVGYGVSRPGEEMPTTFDETDYARAENTILPTFGANSRCVANRAPLMGWTPKHTTDEMLDDTRDHVEWMLRHYPTLASRVRK